MPRTFVLDALLGIRVATTPGSERDVLPSAVAVSVISGSGQVHEPVVRGKQAPDQAQGDHRGGGGGGGQHQEHHDGLDQDGLQGWGTGLVFLPGAMTGLILAGTAPLQAVLVQAVVMFLVLAATATTTAVIALGLIRRLFTSD